MATRQSGICHASLDGASHQIPAFAGMTESGRSMVEMLGVLAVIGVISVGGIGSYSIAMKKHRANELINEVSKRATVVAMQAASGKTGDVSLSEFGDSKVSGGTFGQTAKIENKKIKLTLSGVDEAVCAQMKTSLGDNGIMTIPEECTSSSLTLTFNEDLSRGVNADDSTSSDDDSLWNPDQATPCEKDDDCDTNKCEICDDICVPAPDESNPSCSSCPSGYMTIVDGEFQFCYPCNWSTTIPSTDTPDCATECSGKRQVLKDIRGESVCALISCPNGYQTLPLVAYRTRCAEPCPESTARFTDSEECVSCDFDEAAFCLTEFCQEECKKCNRVLRYFDEYIVCDRSCPAGTTLNIETNYCE